MIAYNHKSLDHLLINEEMQWALGQQLISKEEANAIEKAYPVDLYRPNLFIRIGLLLLTTVIVLMVFGLFCLMLLSGSEHAFGILALVFSLLIYTTLELLIREKKHYRSGIDDALIWLSMAFLVGSVNLLIFSLSTFNQALLICVLTSYFLLRFGNVITVGLAFLSLLVVVFYGVTPLGVTAKTVMPFLMMAICFGIYWIMRKYGNTDRVKYYKTCCRLVEVLALVMLYAAGNYFVVREVSNSMFDLNLKPGEDIPGKWFFWAATVLIPFVYIIKGIQQ